MSQEQFSVENINAEVRTLQLIHGELVVNNNCKIVLLNSVDNPPGDVRIERFSSITKHLLNL